MIEIIPEVAAAGGYLAGQVAEKIAESHVLQNRTALIGAHSGVEGNRSGMLHRATARLALIGAIAGFSFGEATVPHTSSRSQEPVMALAVDHSYATGAYADNSVGRINKISDGVTGSPNLRSQIFLASTGDYDALPRGTKIDNRIPIGSSSSISHAVPKAIDSAYDSSTAVHSNAFGSSEQRAAATLVITDDNAIGSSVESTVQQARADGNEPVYIVNVGQNNDSTARDLQSVAKLTGGRYWYVPKSQNSTSIVDSIRSDIIPHPVVEKQDNSDKYPWLVSGVAALALGAVQFVRRKRETAA